MIELELTQALALYSAVLFVLIVAIWIYTEVRIIRPRRYLGKQFLWRCSFCGFAYLDEQDESLSQCPRCGSFNSATDKDARAVPLSKSSTKKPVEEEPAAVQRNTSRRKRHHQKRRGPRKRG